MAQFDILLSNSQELQADANGDFVTGDATNNIISYILQAAPGHYKEFPLVGVGILKYLNSTASSVKIANAIQVQLTADVFKNISIDASKFPIIQVNNTTFTLQ